MLGLYMRVYLHCQSYAFVVHYWLSKDIELYFSLVKNQATFLFYHATFFSTMTYQSNEQGAVIMLRGCRVVSGTCRALHQSPCCTRIQVGHHDEIGWHMGKAELLRRYGVLVPPNVELAIRT
jgi:hypothetical protein